MISWPDIFRVFGAIGLLSFGGPAAQMALMHRVLVEERKWLSEPEYLRALSFCMLLPGPEAMQLATYAGWRLRGISGGLVAGLLFVLPGALVITLLALGYARFGQLPVVEALFTGIKAVVVVIVIEALLRVSRRALKRPVDRVVAILSFVALYVVSLPFPLVIALSAVWGAFLDRSRPVARWPKEAIASATGMRSTVYIIAVLGLLWSAPLIGLALAGQDFLLEVGLFFSKLAIVTFGGAYAVLSYMTAEVVMVRGWLETTQMIDALGLAETTPGPLILVTQFVAMLAGAAQGSVGMALSAGALTLWVTFVPCFLWVFAGAPHIRRLEHMPRATAALSAITAAVVGVIANLSLWFGLHVLFQSTWFASLGPLRILVPDPTSLAPVPAVILAVAAWLMLWRHWPLGLVLILGALGGLVGSLLLP